MRRGRRIWFWLATVGVLAVTVTVVAVAAAERSGKSSAAAVRETEQAKLRALVAADMPVLERIHADDFQGIAPPGIALSKEELLGDVETGVIDFVVNEPISDIEVRMYGKSAVVRYLSAIEIVAEGIGSVEHDMWTTVLYEKRQGRWQSVWEHATAVGGFPPT